MKILDFLIKIIKKYFAKKTRIFIVKTQNQIIIDAISWFNANSHYLWTFGSKKKGIFEKNFPFELVFFHLETLILYRRWSTRIVLSVSFCRAHYMLHMPPYIGNWATYSFGFILAFSLISAIHPYKKPIWSRTSRSFSRLLWCGNITTRVPLQHQLKCP